MAETRTAADVDELLANADWLRVLAGRLLEDDSEIDDLVHEAWLAALRRPAGELRHLPSWLAAVVCNLSRRRLRHTGRHQELFQDQELALVDGAPTPDEALELELVRRRVIEAVLALPEPFRATILMSFYEGLPPQEIARLSGVPGATVRTRLRRGLQRLRSKLEAESTDRRSRAGLFLVATLRWPTPTARLAAPLGLAAAAAVLGVFALSLAAALGATGGSAASLAGAGERSVAGAPRDLGEPAAAPVTKPEELSREVGPPTGTGSADDGAGDCGGGLLLTGQLVGGTDSGGLLPQPAVRGSSDGSNPRAERARHGLAGAGEEGRVPVAQVGMVVAALRPPVGLMAAPRSAPPAERPGRSASDASNHPLLQPWPGLGEDPQADDEDPDEHDHRRPGSGHHHPPANGGNALLGDLPSDTFASHRKSSHHGAGSHDHGAANPQEFVSLCICPERGARADGREQDAPRVLVRPRGGALGADEAPPACPVHPASGRAAEALLWQATELPDATLVVGFDRAALVARPWDAVLVIALVERSAELIRPGPIRPGPAPLERAASTAGGR